MPDIAMCSNKKCNINMTCYRFKTKPSYRQSYAEFKQDKDGNCDYYWECPSKSIKKRLDVQNQ